MSSSLLSNELPDSLLSSNRSFSVISNTSYRSGEWAEGLGQRRRDANKEGCFGYHGDGIQTIEDLLKTDGLLGPSEWKCQIFSSILFQGHDVSLSYLSVNVMNCFDVMSVSILLKIIESIFLTFD